MTDVQIENHGSIFLFRPLTDAAREWVDEFVKPDNWFGNGFAVEGRYALDLANGMQRDGLVVV